MSNYHPIYRLRIEHDYFAQAVCPVIQLKVTPSALDLMKRRGLIFKQTNVNEWSVIGSCSNAGLDILSDVFTLEMSISDLAFSYYTEWENFAPSSPYRLSLSLTETDATKVILRSNGKRSLNSDFCTVDLRFTEAMFEGEPVTDTLTFHSKELYWEYLFIPNNEEVFNEKEFILKEADEKITFSGFERTDIYGRKALRCQSKDKLKLRASYDFRFSLLELSPNSTNTRKVLIRNVDYPILGNFVAEQADTLLTICYF